MTTPVRDPGPCVVPKVEVKTEDVDATFEDSLSRFQQFIEKQGYPREVVWIACDDLIVTGKGFFYVRVPDVRESEIQARMLFEQGTRQQKGVLFDTICVGHRESFCYAWVPRDVDQAQRAMMSNGLKLSVKTNKIPGIKIRSWFYWLVLRTRYWRSIRS